MPSEPWHNALILIVEDDTSIKELIKVVFDKEKGWKSVTVESGPHAIEAWDQIEFDLILMDLQLPLMGGIEATRKIGNLERTSRRKHVPILAFTAHVSDGCKKECVDAGFDDFIAKPAKLKDVLETVKKHLQ